MRRNTAQRKRTSDGAEIDHRQLLDQLMVELKSLRIAYEKYFAGVEKREPLRARDRFRKRLHLLRIKAPPNTATRFKRDQLLASFVSHESHWNRIVQRIEAGSHRRGRRRPETPAPNERPVTRDRPIVPATAVADPDNHESAFAALHRDFTAAQNAAGVHPVSLTMLRQTVAKQKTAIMSKYGCRDVEFKVGVRAGKPILKAITKN